VAVAHGPAEAEAKQKGVTGRRIEPQNKSQRPRLRAAA